MLNDAAQSHSTKTAALDASEQAESRKSFVAKRKAADSSVNEAQMLQAKRAKLRHPNVSGQHTVKQPATLQPSLDSLQQAEGLAAEQHSDLRDTVGAIVVDASGAVFLLS